MEAFIEPLHHKIGRLQWWKSDTDSKVQPFRDYIDTAVRSLQVYLYAGVSLHKTRN
jgi:hypothetical protein